MTNPQEKEKKKKNGKRRQIISSEEWTRVVLLGPQRAQVLANNEMGYGGSRKLLSRPLQRLGDPICVTLVPTLMTVSELLCR